MSETNWQKLLNKKLTRKQFLLVGAFAIVSASGALALLRQLGIRGITPTTAAVEPEAAVLSGGAMLKTDNTASGSQAIQFGAAEPANSFTEFAPGSVKPLGYADEALGLGPRNVGPRVNNLTPHYGDYTLTPGAKVSGLEIFGRIIGRGDANTLVSDCIVHGAPTPATTNSAAVLGTSYNLGGVKFEWCRFDLTGNEGGFTNAIEGGNYELRYSEITRGVDGVGANIVGNATIHCCRIWGGYYESWWNDATNSVRTTAYTDADGGTHNPPFPAQSSGDTHNDGIQIHQYGGWVIRGCYIGGTRVGTYAPRLDPTVPAEWNTIKQLNSSMDFMTSNILISSASATNPVGALIENNWFSGSAARVNIAYKTYDNMSGVTVRNNRFIRANYGYYLYIQTGCAAVLSNNVYDDTGGAVPIATYP